MNIKENELVLEEEGFDIGNEFDYVSSCIRENIRLISDTKSYITTNKIIFDGYIYTSIFIFSDNKLRLIKLSPYFRKYFTEKEFQNRDVDATKNLYKKITDKLREKYTIVDYCDNKSVFSYNDKKIVIAFNRDCDGFAITVENYENIFKEKEMNEFDLEHQLNNWNISADTLISKYGYKVAISGKTKTVFTTPRTIIFGGEPFIGKFFFKDNIIRHITLEPIIKGIEIPNYPTEEYQNIKYEYCKSILNKIYGDNCHVSSFGVQWDTDKYTIACFKIIEGIDRYTGGNISIDIGSYNERYN